MKRTVFIVGAGASTEFGNMPVGQDLARRIQAQAHDELESFKMGSFSPLIEGLSYAGFGETQRVALQRIQDGILTRDSIDDFVSEWQDIPTLVDVARYCIAHEILGGENATALGKISRGEPVPRALESLRGTWLDTVVRYTNQEMGRRQVLEALAGTSFVTFNYDRCIEFYLYQYLSHSLGLPHHDVGPALRRLNIEHVYGSAGELPELGGHVHFGLAPTHSMSAAANDIRTYCETIEEGRVARIRSLIAAADQIVILGCAFHGQNLKLLFGGRPPAADVWATVYGLGRRQREAVESFFTSSARFVAEDMTAGHLLRTYQDDIF